MELDEYQRQTARTDQLPRKVGPVDPQNSEILVPLLGLAGEVGEVVSEYKKYLRDGASHEKFPERIREELGDLLWYLSNLADKFGLSLSEVAETNLVKTRDRFQAVLPDQMSLALPRSAFDEGFPDTERLPRQMTVELRTIEAERGTTTIGFLNGSQLGDPVRDNRYEDDGYRFHDVFHLAYASVLGWSPIVRSLLKHKRKSAPLVDDVEDGGRAAVIEEGIAAMVFSHAEHHSFFEGAQTLDYNLLRTIKTMTAHLEVRRRSTGEWAAAIRQGFDAWRLIKATGGGTVICDLDAGTIRAQV